MRLIDGDALLNNIRRAMYPSDMTTTLAVGICESHVKDMPTIDAVPVVRCKDCKYYMTIYCPCDGCCISPDWYCADGKRRDTDGKA